MENSNKTVEVTIGIIGGQQREETEEEKSKRIMNRILAQCYYLNKQDINVVKFKELLLQVINKETASTYEILTAYEKLTDEEQQELLAKCTRDKIDLSLSSMITELNKEVRGQYQFIKENPDITTKTPENIKRQLKYCKIPMEKQRLQRELNNMNFMSSKHKNGKHKRRG